MGLAGAAAGMHTGEQAVAKGGLQNRGAPADRDIPLKALCTALAAGRSRRNTDGGSPHNAR
jgi:hypothetical protein